MGSVIDDGRYNARALTRVVDLPVGAVMALLGAPLPDYLPVTAGNDDGGRWTDDGR